VREQTEFAPLVDEKHVFVRSAGPRRSVTIVGAGLALAGSVWIAALVLGVSAFATMPQLHLARLVHPHLIVRTTASHTRVSTEIADRRPLAARSARSRTRA
jgi:hypothetical protein